MGYRYTIHITEEGLFEKYKRIQNRKEEAERWLSEKK